MGLSSRVKLIACIATISWICATLAAPIILPLTHKNAESVSYRPVADELVDVQLVNKYTRDTNANVPLTFQSVIVVCDITVGSKPFIVLIDTGSALLAVPIASCVACDSGAPNPPYDTTTTALSCTNAVCRECCTGSAACPTNTCPFAVTYADNSAINGSLFEDTVVLGGLSATAIFGGIIQESTNFVAPFADGILGFSQNGAITCSPSCIPPIFDVYVNQGLVVDSFGIYLDVDEGGALTLGEPDSQFVTTDFLFTPLIGDNFYQVDLNGIKIAGSMVSDGPFGNTILDSGTTLIHLVPVAYDAIVRKFQTDYCNLVGACGSVTIFNTNCLLNFANVAAYPNIQFELSGVEVTLTPLSYFLPTTLNNGQTAYCFGITRSDQDFSILGYTFMRGYYIFYDRANRKIGFSGNTTLASTSSASSLSSFSSLLLLTLTTLLVALLH